MKRPCSRCPFRKDTLRGWLGRKKATEIVQSALTDSTFYCHRTLDANKEIAEKSQVCAGSVLMHVKEGRANRYYRFIDHEYWGAELVFDSTDELIEHHSIDLTA